MHAAYRALKNLTEGVPETPGKEADPVSGLPAHAASDEDKFTEIFQRLAALEKHLGIRRPVDGLK